MSALRVARGFTRRDVIVKFEGCYHGHADFLLVKAGSGARDVRRARFGGRPRAIARRQRSRCRTTIAPRSPSSSPRAAREIAAVIVEPVVGNMGCVPPEPGFLAAIVELCKEHGALSIFDEVMTGCRVARGGAQELLRSHARHDVPRQRSSAAGCRSRRTADATR